MAMSSAAPAAPLGGGQQSWRRRLKQFIGLHIRQVPCLDAVVQALPKTLRFWRRRKYQTLGQDEEDDGTEVEDIRQGVNKSFGAVVIKAAMLCMVGITVLLVVQNGQYDDEAQDVVSGKTGKEIAENEFKRDAPIVLYLGAIELLVCGACAQTAAAMYTRRKHALQHPRDAPEQQKARYIKVRLEKDPGRSDKQLFGIGFRASTDGLECLLVEDVRKDSLLDRWNRSPEAPSAEQLVEAALGSPEAGGAGVDDDGQAAAPAARKPSERVQPGAAIVAVNHVTADVGMMQAELTKANVTLWVRSEVYHPSQLESEVLAEPDAVMYPPGPPAEPAPATLGASSAARGGDGDGGDGPGPTFSGPDPAFNAFGDGDGGEAQARLSEEGDAAPGPRCACVAFEDEEPQILMRWLVCSVIFGWVTMLPVLLMRPHEERPRQHLFRQYLLKPCTLVMPIWVLCWVLDCIEVLLETQIMHPFYYFLITHMLLPAVLVWYLIQLQAADERLVQEQRKSRQAEATKDAGKLQPVAIEDPAPTLLKELIAVNPVALVWIGCVASIPILGSSLLTPMTTARARMAQGFVHIIYAPMVFLQLAFMYILYHVRFVDLPKFYMFCFGLLLSVPCFVVWCFCLMCASRYGRQDMRLVAQQRVERARQAAEEPPEAAAESGGGSGQTLPASELVDLTEAMHREWEYIYTA